MSNDYENEPVPVIAPPVSTASTNRKLRTIPKEKQAKPNDGLMVIFFEFYTCMNSGASVDSAEAQAFVAKLWVHITLIIDVISF